ncbi:MAG: restriction endonuclease subunit S [Cyclobacteriaceae bacterium]
MEMKKAYKQTEVGIIPSDWEVKSLGECLIGRPKYGIGAASVRYNDTLPTYLRITDISEDGRYLTNDKVSVDHPMANYYYLEDGDIVFARTGASVGKTYHYESKDGKLVFAGFLICVKPDPKILESNYLKYLVQTKSYWSWVLANSMRSGQPGINSQQLETFNIALPPTKSEQTAIASALSDADALITSLEKLIAKKKSIQIVVMEELVSGKKRLKGYEGKWGQFSIAEISKTFTKQTGFDYSAYIKPKLVMKDGYNVIPFIQNKDFNERWINFNTDYYIPENVANQFPKILLDEKCLLISISGSVGKVGIFGNVKKAFLGGAIAVGKLYDKTQLDWVMCYLLSNAGQKKLLDNVKSGSHQNLILDDIRKVYVPMPSLQERNAITDLLFDMNDEIAAFEQKLQKSRMIKQGMMQNLLKGKIRLV